MNSNLSQKELKFRNSNKNHLDFEDSKFRHITPN